MQSKAKRRADKFLPLKAAWCDSQNKLQQGIGLDLCVHAICANRLFL